MKSILLILLTLVACTSRTERINKRLIVLYSKRDSLNIQYSLLQAEKDSLRYVSANTREKTGEPDSLTRVKFFENEGKIEAILKETNKIGSEIKELELEK